MFKNEVISKSLKAAVATIRFEDLARYLPFQTRYMSGDTFNHIQSLHVYDIKTYGKPVPRYVTGTYHYLGVYSPEYTVEEGDTLCRRVGRIRGRVVEAVMKENCPGCEAIAQGIIKRDIEQASTSL